MSPILPTATKTSSAELSKAMESKDVQYKLLYFPVHGLGQLIRNIFVYADVKWEGLQLDWPNQKENTRFHVIPIVWELHSDGTVIELAESHAIERYLARKYDLFGSNAWEAHLVEEFFNNTLTTADNLIVKFLRVNGDDKEKRVAAFNTVLDEDVDRWLRLHEKHLAANGSNGHYVGNKTTVADLMTLTLLQRLESFKPKAARDYNFSRESTPALWKLKETLEAAPAYAKWLASEQYQALDNTSKAIFKL